MGRIMRVVFAFSLSTLLAGCGMSRDYTRLTVPAPLPTVASGSNKAIVIDEVQDRREFQADPRDPSIPSLKKGAEYHLNAEQRKSAIGRKRSKYGMATGDYVLRGGQTVETLTHDLIAATLRGMGYRVSDDANAPKAKHLRVSVDKFWAWMTPYYLWSGIEAELETRLTFSGPSGGKTVEVTGYGRNPIRLDRTANWQIAYDRAFRSYEKNLQQAMRDSGL
jgi:uncharacterized lipoprotein YajG